MFESLETSASSRRISVVTLLMLALVVSPVVVVFSPSPGYFPIIVGVIFSSLCLAIVGMQWKRPGAAKRLL